MIFSPPGIRGRNLSPVPVLSLTAHGDFMNRMTGRPTPSCNHFPWKRRPLPLPSREAVTFLMHKTVAPMQRASSVKGRPRRPGTALSLDNGPLPFNNPLLCHPERSRGICSSLHLQLISDGSITPSFVVASEAEGSAVLRTFLGMFFESRHGPAQGDEKRYERSLDLLLR
jgi:hypothetical protein